MDEKFEDYFITKEKTEEQREEDRINHRILCYILVAFSIFMFFAFKLTGRF